jgi:hypothetical protein
MSILAIIIRQLQAKMSVLGCRFSSGHIIYRLRLIWRCPIIETMSAKETHKIPCVQFAFSDDTVLSESVERAANTRFYPNRIRCTILGKTHRKEVYQQVVIVSSQHMRRRWMSNTVAVNMWLTREFKSTKDVIDSRKSPTEGSIGADFATSPFYPALFMARLDHTCWKSTCEAIKA